ncbi:hypothetical protein Agub_g8238, partial [Astrephomene gubernaculifera]
MTKCVFSTKLLALITIAVLFRSASSSRALIGSMVGSSGGLHSNDCEPSEVHLSLSDDPHEIRVAWRTTSLGCPATVSYGRADETGQPLYGSPLLQAEGSSYSITEGLMCDGRARRHRFTVNMHTAVMRDLDHSTDYWYGFPGSDRTFRFRSPRRVGAGSSGAGSSQRFSFIAFGDLGESRIKRRKCAR